MVGDARKPGLYVRGLTAVVLGLSFVAGAGVLSIMVVVCVDVLMRAFGSPLVGALDIVKITGAITLACSLPYTTAVKGHVAIEYFFHQLSRPWRIVVDTVTRLLAMGLFGALAYGSVLKGMALRSTGEVTMTLRLPMYWVPYLLAFCCAVTVLVILHNLLHPGREMIKP